ncbi:MAG: gliding motility-associated C-terminal domain-containing protein [Schleiferiaceae bacterium]|nr:gliding motility-associated C-terminal domain-containing protein [Schleiferiaceae bacterium]
METLLDGCRDVVNIVIPIENTDFSNSDFPNVITPNGDGINDFWCFEEAASFADCFEIQIFNRWGQQVFQSSTPENCWDPRNLPAGVYFYTSTIGEAAYKGTITVIK